MLTTRVQITAVERVPPPRAKTVTCKYCGESYPRWQRRLNADDQPISGLRRMAAHEIEAHSGESGVNL